MSIQGLIMDVKRMAVHDGPGIRTTLFMKGCPLRCIWCHNPEGIGKTPQLAYYDHKCISCGECLSVCAQSAHSIDETGHHLDREKCTACGKCEAVCLGDALRHYGRPVTACEALAIALEDRAFYGKEGGLTVSGGEPLLQAGFIQELLRAAKSEGLHTAVDTCGCVPWSSYESILPYADMFLYDIKHIDPQQHRRLTGCTNELILDNLTRLSLSGARIEIRMPLVPGCNDDEQTLTGIGSFLGKLRIERMKVLPYHALARSKYRALGMEDTMPDVHTPDKEKLAAACRILIAHGVNAVSE